MQVNEIKDKIILALDVENKDEVKKYIKLLKNKISIVKVGSYLFTKEGPEIIKYINDEGIKIFLDLKFHDIPNTVAKTSEVVTDLGVFMFTIHIAGGKKMMQACVKSVLSTAEKNGKTPPKIVGVTVLSSIDDKTLIKELKIGKKRKSYVNILSREAKNVGLNGIVASGEEIKNIKKKCGKDFLVVVPGIRPSWVTSSDDQKIILTPKEAIKLGADFLVIGRPILQAKNPEEAIERIHNELLV